jgi:prepilin-type N-terminal cleavage/methylation domain-containing protein
MRRKKGFSLIELLIAVAIILIVAAIAIPNLLRSKTAANEASQRPPDPDCHQQHLFRDRHSGFAGIDRHQHILPGPDQNIAEGSHRNRHDRQAHGMRPVRRHRDVTAIRYARIDLLF